MRWLRKGKLRFLQGLLETLIAVAILGAIGVSLLTALDTNARATRTLDEHVVATNLATAYIEAIKASSYAETYDDVVADITIPLQYIVNVNITFSSDGTTWVDYNSEDPQTLQKLAVTVSRDDDRHILTICAFKAKRVGG